MTTEYGVIIGRFQIEFPHKGHRALVNHVTDTHGYPKTIILVGVREAVAGSTNPLSFVARKEMLEQCFRSELIILPIADQPTDEMWVKKVDETIKNVIGFAATATIYHGRSSIGPHYNGRYPLKEFSSGFEEISASEQRNKLGKMTVLDRDIRAGIIHAYQNLPLRTHETVDIAVFDQDQKRLLVVQKIQDGLKWRLPGGFIDRGETSRFASAREVREETGMTIVNGAGGIQLLDDFMIDDWRIRDEPNIQHRTILCYGLAEMIGPPKAGDDVEEVKWLDLPVNQSLISNNWNGVSQREAVIDIHNFIRQNIIESHVKLVGRAISQFVKEEL